MRLLSPRRTGLGPLRRITILFLGDRFGVNRLARRDRVFSGESCFKDGFLGRLGLTLMFRSKRLA